VAALAALAAAGATEAASRFIASRFPTRPAAPDLLFELLPHVPGASYITLVTIAAIVLILAAHLIRTAPGRVPELITVVAVLYTLRAAMIVLTPLAHARDGSLITFPLFENGLFPSGHTAVALLLVWLTKRDEAGIGKVVAMALLPVMIVSMLLSRGHYSIDIVGGALLAYFVWREWTVGRLFDPLRRLVT